MSEENTVEQTQPVAVYPEKAIPTEIPDWLLEFSAAQPTKVECPESEIDEEAIPVVLETSVWHVIQAELDDATLKTDANLDDLLKNGHYALAADLLREQANDAASIEEAQQKLRPALVMNKEVIPLWNIYEELAVKLNNLKQNSENNGG